MFEIFGGVCSLILVGAGFQFHLAETDDAAQNNDHAIATLGVIHNLGQSVASLEVFY